MKKLILSGALIFLLMGCGNDFKYPTKQDKEQFIEKMFKTNDENMQKEYESIINSLKERAGKDKEVREQLEDWQMIYNTKSLWRKTVNVENENAQVWELINGKSNKYTN